MSIAGAQTIFVTGMSGSGKSTAMAALEDLSFYCVDNLPPQLIPQFLDLCQKSTPPIAKVALAVDTREEPFFRLFPEVVRDLRAAGTVVKILFLDCGDEELINRYRETRRVHPLAPAGTVEAGIARERRLVSEVNRLADIHIDTSALNIHQLKETVIREVAGQGRATVINLVSFGFRFGTPRNLELQFDVRVLPNPYFDDALRDYSGLDAPVAEYVLKSELGEALLLQIAGLMGFLLPRYDEEGKPYVTLGIGCTGGRHRSVAMTEALAAELRGGGREVNVEHRDVGRDQ